MSVQEVVDKVQKLLRLSKSNNANEAAAAAAAANKLIDEYRLSEADLEVQGQAEECLSEDDGYIYETGKLTTWKHTLVHVLVKHYGLSHFNDTSYSTGRKVSRFKLIGRKSDITIAKYMFTWLTMECQRLSDLYAKGQGRVYVASYCDGFVNGVAEQLELSRAEVKRAASSAAIVKIDARSELSKKFMYSLHSNLRTVKSMSYSRRDAGAFAAGETSGKNLHLGQSLGAGGVRLLK
jgi:hypothetical protein